MIKKIYMSFFLLVFCVTSCTMSNRNIIMPEWLKIKSSYTLLGTDSSERDKGYRCWLFRSKTDLIWKCTERSIRKNGKISFYIFNSLDIAVESVNAIIPWWRFYYKISRDDVIDFCSFDVNNKTFNGEILDVKTKNGYYLLVTEHGK